MKYTLKEIDELISNSNYGAMDNELIKDGKGIRIRQDDELNSIYYDDFMAYKSFTLAGYSRRYNLNETDIEQPETLDELEKAIKEKYDIMAILPLYMFEHGNMLLDVADFGDRWDSGRIGFVFVTKENAKEFELKDEKDAIESIKEGIKYYNRLNNDSIYSIEFFDIEKCDCCNSTKEINNEFVASCFYDELKDELISLIGQDNIDNA